jgi:hypothetical protein
MFAQTYFSPCIGVEEGSWLWWIRGCWIAASEITGPLVVGVVLAGLVAVMLLSLRQRRTA